MADHVTDQPVDGDRIAPSPIRVKLKNGLEGLVENTRDAKGKF